MHRSKTRCCTKHDRRLRQLGSDVGARYQNLIHTMGMPDLVSAMPRQVPWTTWWPLRGACTRSHPELGRENPQRL